MSNLGDVPDPISYILGCNLVFSLSVMVIFLMLGAWLKVLAKISTWWQLSSRSDAVFSGSRRTLWGFDLPAIRTGSYMKIWEKWHLIMNIERLISDFNPRGQNIRIQFIQSYSPCLDYIYKWHLWDQYHQQYRKCNLCLNIVRFLPVRSLDLSVMRTIE